MGEQDLLENTFRDEIFDYLLGHDYAESVKADYDFRYAMDGGKLQEFVVATQPKEWKKLVRTYGAGARERLMHMVGAAIAGSNLLTCLKQGKIAEDYASGARVQLVYFPSTNAAMTATNANAERNILSVRKEFAYEGDERTNVAKQGSKRVDLAIFLNGLPIFMLELKKQTAGWSARLQGQTQYRKSRDPEALPFGYGRRTLVYFTLDEFEVYMTTRLQKGATSFLPFNRGSQTGCANPTIVDKHPTAYVWEELLAKQNVLRLIKDFLFVDKDDKLIFPRYHQLRAVLRCEADLLQQGIGGRYLIWHSAGSGKTKTIAWLAAILVNKQEVNAVVVISDRVAIDDNLSKALKALYDAKQVIAAESGEMLKTYIDKGGYIIVTTLQKFRDVTRQIKRHPERNYAFIIDEAHSSTAGKSFAKMAETLSGRTLTEAVELDKAMDEEQDSQNRLLQEREYIQKTTNASYFAFTATPKTETMELFGTRNESGKRCFDLYSMQQAMAEGFILNPLSCYTNSQERYQVHGSHDSGAEYDKQRAAGAVQYFVSSRPQVIRRKVGIMLEDFLTKRAWWLGGRAKAMIITPSRLHAVYYKQMVDEYLLAHHSVVKSLVAFTGEIELEGVKYTEANMNPDYSVTKLTDTIHDHDELRIIIVADKLQTGYDEDLLSVLYVDKSMGSSVKAVQTYSRINRPCDNKHTLIMDFANKTADIKAYFEEFYGGDLFLPPENETKPEVLFKLRDEILQANVFSMEDVEHLASLIQAPERMSVQISTLLNVLRGRVAGRPKKDMKNFVARLWKINKLYYYLGTLNNYWDDNLKKFCDIAECIAKSLQQLVADGHSGDFAAANHIELDIYTTRMKLQEQNIQLQAQAPELQPIKTEPRVAERVQARLPAIVAAFNAKYPQGQEEIEKQVEEMRDDEELRQTVHNSSASAAKDTIERRLREYILDGKMDNDVKRADYYRTLNQDATRVRDIVEDIWGSMTE